MFVAGDPSGDEHASHIVRRLPELVPDVKCFGIGGHAMQSAGFEPLMAFEEFNRMGFIEIMTHLPFFLNAKKKLIAAMDEYKPDALVCIDYPGLNIPLMKEAAKRKIPVVWYIVPQVWAWKKKRSRILGKFASFIGTVFPFEISFFEGYNADVSFVGHPLVEAMLRESVNSPSADIKQAPGLNISIIPGSRQQEVDVMLPCMISAAMLIKQKYPDVSITVSKSRNLPVQLYEKACSGNNIGLFEGRLTDLLKKTDYAFVTSGTATLETALAGIPMVIAYRTSQITYRLMKRMIRVPFIGLPNIVAGEKIVPECIQHEASAKSLAKAMLPFMESAEYRLKTVRKLSGLKDMLGSKCPSKEIAEAIAAIVNKPV
jgi:lipid-A-disaccharide synthase